AVARLAPSGMAGTATGGALSVTFFGVVLLPAVFGLLSDAAGSFAAGYMMVAVPIVLRGAVLFRERAPARWTGACAGMPCADSGGRVAAACLRGDSLCVNGCLLRSWEHCPVPWPQARFPRKHHWPSVPPGCGNCDWWTDPA